MLVSLSGHGRFLPAESCFRVSQSHLNRLQQLTNAVDSMNYSDNVVDGHIASLRAQAI